MARTPSTELMVRKSIYGPARLIERAHLSEYVIALIESDTGGKPIDPHFSSIQSKIGEYVQVDPTLPRRYSLDDLATERIIMMKLALEGLEATASEISAAMVAAGAMCA